MLEDLESLPSLPIYRAYDTELSEWPSVDGGTVIVRRHPSSEFKEAITQNTILARAASVGKYLPCRNRVLEVYLFISWVRYQISLGDESEGLELEGRGMACILERLSE